MTIWENRTLREARDIAKAADEAWNKHKHDCVTCARAQRQRKLDQMCQDGWAAYRTRRDASAALEAERELAKQPVPGQGELDLFSEQHA